MSTTRAFVYRWLCLALLFWICHPVLADSFRLEITSYLGDRQTFQQGDTLSFLISMNHDAYLIMLYQDAQGIVTQILPNAYLSDTLYKAGLYFSLPDADQAFRFTVQPPFGEERIWVFAGTTAFEPLPGVVLGNGFRQLNIGMQKVRKRLRAQSSVYLGEAYLEITTRSQGQADFTGNPTIQ